MTDRPLDFDFPLMSAMSVRPPHGIADDEQSLDVEAETERRVQLYPRQIAKGALSQEDADRHLGIWRQIQLDLTQPPAAMAWHGVQRWHNEHDARRAASPFRWAHKVRELRREIALRRNFYPRQIARGGDAEELRQKLERIEAVHFNYWIQLRWFDAAPPGRQNLGPLLRQAAARIHFSIAAARAGDRAFAGLETLGIYNFARLIDWYDEQYRDELLRTFPDVLPPALDSAA